MKKGTINKENSTLHSGKLKQRVTIIKHFWYNAEGWYLTKEIGRVPDWFIDELGGSNARFEN